jgi:hypothetical protein
MRIPVMSTVARIGLTARGFVYLVLGWLTLQIARGHAHHQANSRGALAEIRQQPDGVIVLWILAGGLAAYAGWRLSQAVLGTGDDGAGPRLAALVGGLIYTAFCIATVGFLLGRSRETGSQQQVTFTSRVMRHTDGRWLVGLIGVIVVIVGVTLVIQGARRTFEKNLSEREMSSTTRAVVVGLGTAGTVARGIVFAAAGAFVADAAVTFDARKSTGLDGALHTFAEHSYGEPLLIALGVGFAAFGLFGFAEARWSKPARSPGRRPAVLRAARGWR